MSKLLKVMVFIILIVGCIALSLAIMLFNKRELVIGRTRKLENAIIAVGSTLEKEPAVVDSKPHYPAKDISDVTSGEVDAPQLSKFWDSYDPALEIEDQPMLNLAKKKNQLMTYYKIDPVTGKPEKGPMGNKLTSGKGTMQEVLDEVISKANEQHDILNATREQLVAVRKELVSTISEYNALKQNVRASLKDYDDMKSRIMTLGDELNKQKEKVAELEDEKIGLEDTIAEQRRTIADDADKIAENELKIKNLKAELKRIRDLGGRSLTSSSGGSSQAASVAQAGGTAKAIQIDPGKKGEVIAVNSEWNFVVAKLSDKFFNEIMPDANSPVPQITLMIKRIDSDNKEVFVTKAKLIQVKRGEKIGIFDMLPDWQQMPAKKGDVLFY